ncbi:hypothetical protein C8R45DRAFT_1214663 [Mycena sanguinolenta]|nr:hypothetical protein C8R45DRAFT_1214663 [Mycena sanguinolenta]
MPIPKFPRYLRQATRLLLSISSVALSHHCFSPDAWPLVLRDRTLRVLDPTIADVAPTGASSSVATPMMTHASESALGLQLSASRLMAWAIVGGGLAGLSAAHAVLGRVRSTLPCTTNPPSAATPPNPTLRSMVLEPNTPPPSSSILTASTHLRRPALTRPELIASLTANFASAIAWLTDTFNVELSFASRLREHSIPRTHRDELRVWCDHWRATLSSASSVGGCRAEAKGSVPSLPAAMQLTPLPLASSRATASISSRSARQAATTHPGPRACPLRPRHRTMGDSPSTPPCVSCAPPSAHTRDSDADSDNELVPIPAGELIARARAESPRGVVSLLEVVILEGLQKRGAGCGCGVKGLMGRGKGK